MLFQFICQSINRVLKIQNNYRAVWSNQHGVGEGKEEGEIWVRGWHQQEDEHAATSSASTTPKSVRSREEGGGHLQDKHGKEAQGVSQRKQEQPGKYIYSLYLNASVVFWKAIVLNQLKYQTLWSNLKPQFQTEQTCILTLWCRGESVKRRSSFNEKKTCAVQFPRMR